MSTATTPKQSRMAKRNGEVQRLTHAQIKKFARPVRDLLITITSEYGIKYRLQADGQHVMLYTGDRADRPYKVSAARPAETSVGYITMWAEANVPGFAGDEKKEVESKPLFKCGYGCDSTFHTVEEVNHHYEENHRGEKMDTGVMATDQVATSVEDESPSAESQVVATSDDFVATTFDETPPVTEGEVPFVTEDGWTRYVYSTGRISDTLEVKDGQMRCNKCDFTREGGFSGVHLHEAHHTGQAEGMIQIGQETKKVRAVERHQQAIDSLNFLAKPHGLVVLDADDLAKQVESNEADRLQEENGRLQKELDEVRAKLHLIQEAMGL